MEKIFFLVMFVLETSFTYSQTEIDTLLNQGYGPALSPLNDSMPIRKQTLYIILHTMEGNCPGCLTNLKDGGLCNYAVFKNGRIVPIIDEDRVSNNAGHSFRDGMDSISLVSVGIEFAGYYNEVPTRGQLSPRVKVLIAGVQERYGIPDSNVLIHPMVAVYYPDDPGNPHPGFYSRGRKHDAYYFAKKWVRDSLGLTEMATIDPDVYSGLVIQNKSQALRFYHHYVTPEEIVAYQTKRRTERDSSVLEPIKTILVCEIQITEQVVEEFQLASPPKLPVFVLQNRRKNKNIDR